MEFFKSLYLVANNKFFYHFYRNTERKQPKRIYQENDFLKKFNSFFFSEPNHIIDNIYLGNGNNAANLNTLKKFNIKYIINVTQELDNYFEQDFDYHKCNLLDEKDNNISEYFPKLLNIFNENKDKNILVHCFMGSSRSAIVVLLYLIKIKHMDFDKSLEFLKNKRDIVNINIEFIEQLNFFLS
jgi:protein tyrosine/serine phosphatase